MGNVSAAPGDIIYVNSSGGQDTNDGSTWLSAKKTIKNATGTVNNDGTINIAKGQYFGINNTQITINKNITINGENKKTTIINGSGNNWIFLIQAGEVVKLNKITLTNGFAYRGGAIYNNGTLTLGDSNFLNNRASDFGGAIYNGNNLIITDSNFSSNTADYYGGAIFSGENSNLNVLNTQFTYNSASSYDGGAIYNYENCYLTVNRCNFTNNNVGGGGGAIQNYGGTCNVRETQFSGNNAAIWGGSISNFDGSFTHYGNLNVVGSTFINCSSSYGYGAIYDAGMICNIIGNNIIGSRGCAIYSVNPNTQIHFNRILNSSENKDIWGISGVNATNNWWGTNFNGTNPVKAGRVNNNVNANSWLILNLHASANTIHKEGKSTLILDLEHDNNGNSYSPANGHVPDMIPVNFITTLGSIISPINTTNGTAFSILYGESQLGTAYITATVDNQSVQIPLLLVDPPKVNATITSGIYNTTQNVALLLDQPGTIYYTLNGNTPTTSSAIYNDPLRINTTTILKYFAVSLLGDTSSVYTATYIIDTLPPKASSNIKSGAFNITPIVKLTMNEPGTIYYTLNGKIPTIHSIKYTGPIQINSTSTLKYFAVDFAGNKSPLYTNTYTIDKTAPSVASTTPVNNATGVSLTSTITIKFSEQINKSIHYSNIYIKNISTGHIAKSTVISISGNTLILKMNMSRLSLKNYQVHVPQGAIQDHAGNKNSAYVLNFKTSKY